MLTEEERQKIIEEEKLRLSIRSEHYNRPVVRPFLGNVFIFMVIWGGLFFVIAVVIILLFKSNEKDLSSAIMGALFLAFIGALFIKNMFKKRAK